MTRFTFLAAVTLSAACGGEQSAAPPLPQGDDADATALDSGDGASEMEAHASPVPVSLSVRGSQTCAARSDGTVTCWGIGTAPTNNGAPTPLQAASQISRVSVGGVAICLLSDAALVDCFGDDTDGTVGDGHSGAGVSVASPTPALLSGTSLQVAVGGRFACALGSDAVVRCWGNNDDGQLGANVAMGGTSGTPVAVAGAPSATAIATSDTTACALTTGGSVVCWGDGEDGELGDGVSTTTYSRSTVAPVQALPSNAAQISAGQSNVCAVVSNGDVWCWGANDGAQLGGGTPGVSVAVPQKINVSNVSQVAIADFLGCAVIADGTVQCWGASDLAASGVAAPDGGTGSDGGLSYQTPMRVLGIPLASQVVIGGQHSCILGRDGTVWCWGANTAGQLGPNAPAGNDPPTQIPL